MELVHCSYRNFINGYIVFISLVALILSVFVHFTWTF